ncbi:MAG TPA: acetate--CoA ligase [Candidatus Dojkabacteria bacterium]|nr:acetate--CoA ligase [Candidatus Dojkabacteria bacterium]
MSNHMQTNQITSWQEYEEIYKESIESPEKFWSKIAEEFTWHKKWDEALSWEFETPKVEWFKGGKLNITENLLDRNTKTHPEKIALIWEPNDPREGVRKFSYNQLTNEVGRFANVLKSKNIKKGDRVCIYMPMVPELTFAVLACARIGAIHSVVFAGFSANSLKERINDSDCTLLITSDGLFRGEKTINLKEIADEALEQSPSIKNVIVLKRTGIEVNMMKGRDSWWHDEIKYSSSSCEPEIMDSEDNLFILYTSGSTGKPKGVVHTIAGYMIYAYYTFLNVFQYHDDDIFWCTADVGWITGHSYMIYGPLLNGATVIMFEGVPTWPDASRFWEVIEKHNVTKFYTAPTAIRSLMAQGDQFVNKYDMPSLKVLGSVGEPINEEAWKWYHEKVGKKRCPIVDTWWQTETGGIMLSSLAGLSPETPSWVGHPLPGIQPIIVDEKGKEILEDEKEGLLCFKSPWPGIIRTTYGDHERCRMNYFSRFPKLYFSGDACKKDINGNFRIIGRVDDVINVSGHRLGTAEIESAINEHQSIIESAVVAYPHPIKGQGIFAFIISTEEISDLDKLTEEIKNVVSKIIGPIAKPDKILLVKGLPKTRSGKIMRRILRKIAQGETGDLGDTSTLVDPNVVSEIIKSIKTY